MEDQDKKLIDLLEQKKVIIKEDAYVLSNVLQSLQSIFERYYGVDKAFVKKIHELEGFTRNLIHVKRDAFPMFDRCNTKDISEDIKVVIDTAIEEIKAIGLPKPVSNNASNGFSINNTLSQTQNQSQDVNLINTILLDAIKDELTGKQRKEILSVAKEAHTPEEAHKGIVEKLKEFGPNVSASIVANILTNPRVWEAVGSII